jgi:hypothetical protein
MNIHGAVSVDLFDRILDIQSNYSLPNPLDHGMVSDIYKKKYYPLLRDELERPRN